MKAGDQRAMEAFFTFINGLKTRSWERMVAVAGAVLFDEMPDLPAIIPLFLVAGRSHNDCQRRKARSAFQPEKAQSDWEKYGRGAHDRGARRQLDTSF
jgi:hypothetical protein